MYAIYIEQMWYWLVWENLPDLFSIIRTRKNKLEKEKCFGVWTQILVINWNKGPYTYKYLAYNT